MWGAGGNIARGALLTLLLAPLVVILDRLAAVGELTLFVLAGAALIPLSWLIGEATDNLARHTGPGIGGFLNATFGNAPELIIAIIAASGGLTAIVRASLVGSIASNLLRLVRGWFPDGTITVSTMPDGEEILTTYFVDAPVVDGASGYVIQLDS